MFTCCKAPARGFGRATKTLSTTPRQDVSRAYTNASSSAKERQRADREQLTRLLKESLGRRDARNFLKQFDAPKVKKHTEIIAPEKKQTTTEAVHHEWGITRTGVNLGNLYQPTVFTRDPLPDEKYVEEEKDEPLHLALVKLRQPQTLDDRTLGGIALTLSQMAQLGLSTAVVLDCKEHTTQHTQHLGAVYEAMLREQGARFIAALEEYNEPGALLVDHALGSSGSESVAVKNNFLLYPPIHDGVIPVILPFAYDDEFKKVSVEADAVLLALIREFVSKQRGIRGSNNAERLDRLILDRVIILDPLGGIPSQNRSDGAHVFVNLEAEYHDIKQELEQLSVEARDEVDNSTSLSLGSGNPISRFVEQEIVSLPSAAVPQLDNSAPTRHLKNLNVVQRALKLLPPTSSGLILTPPEAATKAIPDDARTTPSKNPLLHNLLTDKPMISSSLPTTPASRFLGTTTPNPATFLKKGVPLTMIPDPRVTGPWFPPSPTHPSINLATDPRIDFPKLEALINDSFRRKLHAQEYLARVHGRVAGIIIAGDYEGGAICTWETPSALLHTTQQHIPPSASSTPDSPYWVPYLDKFAVRTSSQGSGGVSDIVWAALTRTCFPGGVVWRSRTSNPVNRWYQERAVGTWNLEGGKWTMFWTVGGVCDEWDWDWGGKGQQGGEREMMRRWDAYVDVCKGIVPSWADGIDRAD